MLLFLEMGMILVILMMLVSMVQHNSLLIIFSFSGVSCSTFSSLLDAYIPWLIFKRDEETDNCRQAGSLMRFAKQELCCFMDELFMKLHKHC